MALQGTIDTFPLADVLTLIASSARSGRLTLTGDRGTASVWLDRDMVVGGQLDGDRVADPRRAVFELLRFAEGSFVFDAVERDGFPDLGTQPVTVEESLTTARTMADEWERIEALVPSSSHRVGLVGELATSEVTIDAETWRILVNITRSSSVGHLAMELGLDEYDSSVLVASLVENGLVEISDPWDIDALLMGEAIDDERGGIAAAGYSGANASPGPWESDGRDEVDLSGADADRSSPVLPTEPTSGDTSPAISAPTAAEDFPEHFPIDDLIPDTADRSDDPWNVGRPATDDMAVTFDRDGSPSALEDDAWPSTPYGMPYPDDAPDARIDGESLGAVHDAAPGTPPDTRTEDVLRQMSTLSPSAAEAVAATLAGEGHDEQEDGASPQRRRRGLFRSSGLFGGNDDLDDRRVDDAIGSIDAPEVSETGSEPDGGDGNTSISYLDSF